MDEGTQRSTAFLAAIVASAQDAIISGDLEERITTWNPAAERLFGYTAAEAIGQPYALIMPAGNEAERRAFLAQVQLQGASERVEATRRRKDGTLIDVETTVATMRDPGGQLIGYASITRDISERTAAAAEREATHQNFRDVLERITDAFLALDADWRFTYVNASAEQLMGRTREDLLGINAWEAFPEVREMTVYTATQQAMAEGITTSFEFFYPPFSAWFEGRVYPSAAGVSVFFRDVTAQKQTAAFMAALIADLQRANRELEQLSAAKSDFVSTISHELRTPLTSIQGFSELIQTEAASLAEAQAFAQTINQNAVRLARMIRDVLDLDAFEVGQREIQRDPLNLNQLVERVLASMQAMVTRHHVVTEFAPTLPAIRGDADLLARVITNLVANAVKYSPAGGPITITTLPGSGGVELTVADQGLGVPVDHRETIFARYGRIARPEQAGIEGTGLGLPIARHILEIHNGRIWAEGNTPAGSVFHVVLPVAEPP